MLLCFKCGNLKPESPVSNGMAAVFTACRTCGFASSGDANLDLTFSDARMSNQQLTFFGAVFQAIKRASEDDAAVYWTFIHYVTSHYPAVLNKAVPGAHVKKVEELYHKVEWPAAEPEPPSGEPPDPSKRWWQFWK